MLSDGRPQGLPTLNDQGPGVSWQQDEELQSGLSRQSLIGVQDAFGVQHDLELLHKLHGLRWLAIAEYVLLLEAKAMLSTDTAPLLRCPGIYIGLQGTEQLLAKGLCRHIQVKVAIPWGTREQLGWAGPEICPKVPAHTSNTP